MSCILYSKASFDALANRPTIRRLHRDLLTHKYATPADFVAALFELNVRAFNDRYESQETKQEAFARRNPNIDSEFAAFIDADQCDAGPLKLVMLHKLLGRIHYQVSDASNFEQLEITWHLRWCQEWVADQMAEVITARLT